MSFASIPTRTNGIKVDYSWFEALKAAGIAVETYVTANGVIFPSFTTTQRNAIVSPVAGQAIWNSTTLQVNVYNGTSWVPVGTGGAGGSFQWFSDSANAPTETVEFNQKVYKFSAGLGQTIYGLIQVPSSYISGSPISVVIAQYTASTSNTQLMTAVASLIRSTDPAGSATNQRTTTNTALTNTIANQVRRVTLDVTDSTGKINGVSVSAGDQIEVALSRGTDTDTDDIRLRGYATEVTFQ
jgi:hypothetical protein